MPTTIFQARAFPVSAAVRSTALTTHIIAMSSGTACSACDSCLANLDAYFICVWLGEQPRAAARDRTGAGRVEAAHAIHTAMQPTTTAKRRAALTARITAASRPRCTQSPSLAVFTHVPDAITSPRAQLPPHDIGPMLACSPLPMGQLVREPDHLESRACAPTACRKHARNILRVRNAPRNSAPS